MDIFLLELVMTISARCTPNKTLIDNTCRITSTIIIPNQKEHSINDTML